MRSANRNGVFVQPWFWSYLGALLVWLAAIVFTRGYGAGGMITAGLALAVFSMIALGILAALASGGGIGIANYLLIWLLRIPPIIATLSASFIIQSMGISYGRGLQIKPPPAFADFTTAQVAGIPVLAIGTVIFTIVAGVLLH